MTEQDAIYAAKVLLTHCDLVECQDCVFCLNPDADYGYKKCFFQAGNVPSNWDTFLEAQHDD